MRWPTVKIDAIKAATRYSLVGGPFGSNLTTRDYVEQGVPVIRGSNLPDDREFSTDDCVFVSAEKANALQSNTAYPGDLVFTQRGTLGQVGLIPMNSPFPRYIISQSQMKLTVDEAKADARFVYYFFRSPATVQHILNHVSSSGVPHINLGVLKETEIPLPPLDVQRRIAETLTGYDDLLVNNQRRVALLGEAARRLYREWFIHLRAPGLSAGTTKDSLPASWELRKLGEIIPFTIGGGWGAEKRDSKHSETAFVIRGTDLPDVQTGALENVPLRFHVGSNLAKRQLLPGDIILEVSNGNLQNIGRSMRIEPELLRCFDQSVMCASFCRLIRPASEAISQLVSAHLSEMQENGRMEHFKTPSAAGINNFRFPGLLEEERLVVPPANVLSDFCTVVAPLRRQAAILVAASAKLRAARDMLLPRLMTGDLEIPAKWLAA